MATVKSVEIYGNQLMVLMNDGEKIICVPTGGSLWLPTKTSGLPVGTLIDTFLPGHSVTNPGGTIASGWQWHLDNNSGRGGVDLNYNFQNILAPAAGTVTHFDLPGVGMVIKLILDDPVARINPRLTNDQQGPLIGIWAQHCSAANDGHVDQNDVIGVSGDGYGAYAPHLHIHGMINANNTAPASSRANFWGFV